MSGESGEGASRAAKMATARPTVWRVRHSGIGIEAK